MTKNFLRPFFAAAVSAAVLLPVSAPADDAAPAKPAPAETKKPLAVRKLTPELLKGEWKMDLKKTIEACAENDRAHGVPEGEITRRMKGSAEANCSLPSLSFGEAMAVFREGSEEGTPESYTTSEDGDALIVSRKQGKDGQTVKLRMSLMEDGTLHSQKASGGRIAVFCKVTLTPETIKGEWNVDVARTVAARRAAKPLSDAEAAGMQQRLEGLRPVFRFDGKEETFAANGGGWSRAYTAEAKDGALLIQTRKIGSDETEAAKVVVLEENTVSLEQPDGALFVLQRAAGKASPAKPAVAAKPKKLAVKKLTPDGLKGTWEVDIEQSILATLEKAREKGMPEEEVSQIERMMRSDTPNGLPRLTFDGVSATAQEGNHNDKKNYTAKQDGDALVVTMKKSDDGMTTSGETMRMTLMEDGTLRVRPVRDEKRAGHSDKEEVFVVVLRKAADLPK